MWISSGDVTLHVTMRRTRTADTRLKPMSSIRASRIFSFACRWHFVDSDLCSYHAVSHRQRIVPTIGVHHGHDGVDCALAQYEYSYHVIIDSCLRMERMFIYSYYLLYTYSKGIATDVATNATPAAALRQSCSCCLAASPAASGCCRFVAVSTATAHRHRHRRSSVSSQRSNMRVITV